MRLVFTLAAAASILLAGCSSSPLTGKWKDKSGSGQGATTLEFRGDGTFVMSLDNSSFIPGHEGPMVAAEGKYELKGEVLTMNVEKSPLADEVAKEMNKLGGKGAPQSPGFQPQTVKYAFKFSDNDTIEMTDNTTKQTQVFVRAKS